MVQWKRSSGTQTCTAAEPLPVVFLRSTSQRSLPDARALGQPRPQRIAQPRPTPAFWDSLPLPISDCPQPPGQGLAHRPAFSCLAVTHLVPTGSPSLAGMPLLLLGVVFGFVGVPGAPASFFPGGRLTGLAERQGLPPCFFRAECLQSHRSSCHSVGISHVIIIVKA